jgi:hypothetical protein
LQGAEARRIGHRIGRLAGARQREAEHGAGPRRLEIDERDIVAALGSVAVALADDDVADLVNLRGGYRFQIVAAEDGLHAPAAQAAARGDIDVGAGVRALDLVEAVGGGQDPCRGDGRAAAKIPDAAACRLLEPERRLRRPVRELRPRAADDLGGGKAVALARAALGQRAVRRRHPDTRHTRSGERYRSPVALDQLPLPDS